MSDGSNGLRRGLGENEMRANVSKCCKFVYVRGAKLWGSGEDGNGSEWVKPM